MVTMIGCSAGLMKQRKDKLNETCKDISKETISSLKIIKIETSSLNDSFISDSTRIGLSPSSPKSPLLLSSSSSQSSTVITSIRVSPSHRSQCYITATYSPYHDLIRTNVINSDPSPLPSLGSKSSPGGEPATSTSSPSPVTGTVSSSSVSVKSRNGRSGNKRNGRWTFTNCRERQRQQSVNEAFQELRSKIPTQPVDKKLSKCSILTRAIEYIKLLNGILEKMDDDNSDDCYPQGIRKRPRYNSDEIETSISCKPSSRNSLLTSSSSSSVLDYESDGPDGGEEVEDEELVDEEEEEEEERVKNDDNQHGTSASIVSTRKGFVRESKRLSSSVSRVSSCTNSKNRPLETNVSITRVNTTALPSPQFNQMATDRVILNCSPSVTGSACQRSYCIAKESLGCDGFSQDSQETIRSSEDKIIMDDVSLVSYEFDSSREQSISSTVSSPSDSD